MSSTKKGVAKVIATKESQAIYTHWYEHALNIGVGDTVKQYNSMKSASSSRNLSKEMPCSRSSRLSLHLICLAFVCCVQLGGLCMQYLYSVYWMDNFEVLAWCVGGSSIWKA